MKSIFLFLLITCCFSSAYSWGKSLPSEVKIGVKQVEHLDIENLYKLDHLPEEIIQQLKKNNYEPYIDRVGVTYSYKTVLVKIETEEEKEKIFFDILFPGQMLLYDKNFKRFSSYNMGKSNVEGFYPIFDLEGRKTIYLIRNSDQRFDGTIFFPTKKTVSQYENYNFTLIMLYVGSAIFLILFQFGHFVITKSKSFLFYVLFYGCLLIVNCNFSLLFNRIFHTNTMENLTLFFCGLSGFCCMRFTRYFLDYSTWLTPKHIKISKFFEYLVLSSTLIFLSLQSHKYILANYIDFLLVVSISHILYRGFLIHKKSILGTFFLFSWVPMFSSVFIVLGFQHGGFFEEYFILRFSPLIGCSIQGLLHAFGLGYKVKLSDQEKVRAQLEASEKKTYQNQLRILAHDIANPLAVAMSSLKIIDKKPNVIDRVKRAHTRISEILNAARTAEKNRFASKHGFTLAITAFNHLKDNFQEKLDAKEINLNYDGNEQILIPVKDNILSENLLGNLLSNAIKFSPKGKTITLSVKEDDSRVYVSLKDSGKGISEANLAKLNDGCVITTLGLNNEKGTGLGTQIIGEIMEGYKGEMTIDSTIDIGSTFTLTFPKAS